MTEVVRDLPFTMPRTGRPRLLVMQFAPLRDRDGAVIGVVGLVLQDDPRESLRDSHV